MIAACYTMDLYCRNSKCVPLSDMFPDTLVQARAIGIIGETYGECKKQAQKLGWVFGHDGDVTCPACAKKRRTK